MDEDDKFQKSNKLLDIGAEAYRNGDYLKAQKYYEYAAKLGNTQAICNLGYIYEYGRTGKRDYKKAFYCFKIAADDGSAEACYKVGDSYFYGDAIKQNYNLAFEYYIKAEDFANKSGIDDDIKSDIYYRLALCLYKGYGTDEDPLSALEYINEAEYYSYCDRFEDKFMWQSIAKRIESLRAEILQRLDEYLKN